MGEPTAVVLRAHLARGDWRSAADLLGTLEHPDDVSFHLRQAGEVDGVEEWVPDWIHAEPRSALPLLVAGQRHITWAWQARTEVLARYVSEERFRLFYHRLHLAEALLRRAADLAADDPTPWAFLLTTARGLELGQAEAARRFGEVTARHPWHYTAHIQLLQQLCPKWGGSFQAVDAFVDRTLSGMPTGSALGVLVPYAHMEQWMQLDDETGARYFAHPTVRADLHVAADRSVRHPAYARRPGWALGHNMFAWSFARTGDFTAAAEQFAVLGDLVTDWPWGYLPDDPAGRFAATRDEVRRALRPLPAAASRP